MATSPSTLEYVISIVFNQGQVRGATQAMDALEKKAQGNVDAMKKLGAGNKEIERSYSDATQKINGIMTPLMSLTQKFRDNKGIITETTRYYEKHGRTVREVTNMVEATTNVMEKHTQSIGTLAAGFAKLALRAAVVVPIWMIIRTVFGTLQKLITDSLTTWVELSREMARVGSTGVEAANNMAYLKTVVLDFSTNSSKGFKEVASAMYQLGSAGLSVTETVQGLPHVMNLAIASFANTEQTAKLVAGAYNVFGAALENTFTVSAKFKEISDILAYTYAKQQVELEDLSNAMSYVASAAGMMEIDFNTLVTTIGVLNTGMLKGSKAGVALMNSFIQIAAESSKLSDLGVIFDPSKPLDFANVVDQLHDKYGNAALSLTNLKEIMDVFGQRGGRAMAQLIADYDRWRGAIDNAKASYKDFAADFAKVAEQSLPAAWEKMWNSMKANMIQSLTGVEGFLVNMMNKLGDNMQNSAFLKEWRKNLTDVEVNILEKGTPQEKTELRRQLAPKVEILESTKKIQADIKLEKLAKERKTDVIDINEEIKKVVASGGDDIAVQTKINSLIWGIVKNEENAVEVARRLGIEYMNVAKQAKKIADEPFKFTDTQVKEIRDMGNTAKYELMRASGAKDTAVTYEHINDLITNSNVSIDKFNAAEREKNKLNKDYKMQLKDRLNIQEVLNSTTNKEILSLNGVADAQGNIMEIVKARIELEKQAYAQQMEYAMKLKGDMSSVFKDVLLGEDTIDNMGKRIGDSMRTNIAEALANSLSMGVLQTGLGEVFGGLGASMENLFSGPGGMFTSAIVKGVNVSAPTLTTTIVDAHTAGGAAVAKAIIDANATVTQTNATQQTVVPPVPPTTGGVSIGTPATSALTQVGVSPTQATVVAVDTAVPSVLEQQKAELVAKIAETNALLATASMTAEQRAEKERQDNIATFDKYATLIGNSVDKLVTPIEDAWNKSATELSSDSTIKQKEIADAFANSNMLGPLADPTTLNSMIGNINAGKINKTIEDVTVKPATGIFEDITLNKGFENYKYQGNETDNTVLKEQLTSQLTSQQEALAAIDAQMLADQKSAAADMVREVAKSTEEGAAKGTEKGTIPIGNQLISTFTNLLSGLSGGGGNTAGAAGIAGATGIVGAAGIVGSAMPFFQTPVGGTEGLTPVLDAQGNKTGKYKTAAGDPAATYGSMFGGAVTGAMMGYSQYQSMTSKGANSGYAAAAGGLMGVGGMIATIPGGYTQIIGGVMMAAGYLMQSFQKGKTDTTVTESTKTEQKQVTSRIDVTNKQLEVVNRNLVSLKEEMTYIMQQSYYFRERSTEDRYSIDSQRGNT